MRSRFAALALLASLSGVTPARAAEPSGEKFPDAEAPLGLLPTPPDALSVPLAA